ncbi:MAG: hypothetical protein V4478_03275 [Patescibacteria group bacterium]
MAANKTSPKIPKEKTLKNINHELFCMLYAGGANPDFFGNASKSYLAAFKYDEQINKLEEELKTIPYSKDKERKEKQSAILKVNNSARVLGNRLLTKVDIKARVAVLYKALYTHDAADQSLAYAMRQRKDIASAVSAVKEYNRVTKRVEEKVEITNKVYRWATTEEEAKTAANGG